MAATLSAAATTHDSGTAALTETSFAVTAPGGSNRLLVVKVCRVFEISGNVSTVTYGGQALTRVGGVVVGNNHSVEIWVLNDAGISAASSTTLELTTATGTRWGVIAEPWQDVDQTTAYENFTSDSGSSATPTLVVTSASGDIATAAFTALGADAYTNNATVGDTSIAQFGFGFGGNATRSGRALSSYSAGAASATLDWTLNASGSWCAAGISINSAGGGGSTAASEATEEIAEAGDVWDVSTVFATVAVHDAWTEGAEAAEGFSTFEIFEPEDEGASGGDFWATTVVTVTGSEAVSVDWQEGANSGDSWTAVAVSHAFFDEGVDAGDRFITDDEHGTGSSIKRLHIRTGL